MVVLVSTVYLYCIQQPRGVRFFHTRDLFYVNEALQAWDLCGESDAFALWSEQGRRTKRTLAVIVFCRPSGSHSFPS